MKFYKLNGFVFIAVMIAAAFIYGQTKINKAGKKAIDISDFADCSHHWYDINEEYKHITPLASKPKYKKENIKEIADNIVLFQKDNGGWPKNYDMLAILTPEQKNKILKAKSKNEEATIDNGATHSHVKYLAAAYHKINEANYKDACLKGIDYILAAQYPNGGWPQFYPDTSGYRRYITFNDGAMIGCMEVLASIVSINPNYEFVDETRRQKVIAAYNKGIECILNCQIVENGIYSVWCQQHDQFTLKPQNARAFELAAICNGESSQIVEFLMDIDSPSEKIKNCIVNAVKWFENSKLSGIKVVKVKSQKDSFQYHTADFDRVVKNVKNAPSIWPRFSELGTHKPLFCNRDSKPVYSLAEVAKERRTGYGWYTYAPQKVLNKFNIWKKKWM